MVLPTDCLCDINKKLHEVSTSYTNIEYQIWSFCYSFITDTQSEWERERDRETERETNRQKCDYRIRKALKNTNHENLTPK